MAIPAFLSYSTRDRQIAAEVKGVLAELGVDAFMAHDDIQVSQEWRDRILSELRVAKIFVPLLSVAFRQSDWTSQEVGVAVARRSVLIIPASLDDTVPYGFIGAFKSRRLPRPATVDFFSDAVARKFPRVVIGRLIDRLANSGGWRIAEANFRPLLPLLDKLTPEEARRIAVAATQNSEIWDAGDCHSEYLPAFIEKNRHQLDPAVLRPLEYQVQHRERYQEGSEV